MTVGSPATAPASACVVALDDRFYHPGEFKRVDFSCNTQFGSYTTEALAGHLDAKLFDVGAEAVAIPELLTRIEQERPDLVVVIPCGRYRQATYRLAENVISASGCRLALLAGPCLPDDPVEVLERSPLIDGVLLGDDFGRVAEVGAVLADSQLRWRDRISSVTGFAWRTSSGSVTVVRQLEAPTTLGTLSVRRRAGALRLVGDRAPSDPDRYGKWLIDSSIGCPRKCIYCRTPVISRRSGDSSWRPRPAEDIAEEMSEVVTLTGTDEFRFQDDNFLMPTPEALDRAIQLAQELAARKVSASFQIMFHSSVVTDSPREHLDEALASLQACGLERVFLGIESGHDETLRYFRKGATRKDNDTAINYLSDRGLLVICGSVVFHPRTTIEQLSEERRYFTDLVGRLEVAALSPLGSYAHLIPGAELEDEVIARGLGTSDEAEFRPADEAAARALSAMLVFRRYVFTHDWFVFTVKRDLCHWVATGADTAAVEDTRSRLESAVRVAAVAAVDHSWAVIESAANDEDWRNLILSATQDLYRSARAVVEGIEGSPFAPAWRASLYHEPVVPARWNP